MPAYTVNLKYNEHQIEASAIEVSENKTFQIINTALQGNGRNKRKGERNKEKGWKPALETTHERSLKKLTATQRNAPTQSGDLEGGSCVYSLEWLL
jgi:hypothetical protein